MDQRWGKRLKLNEAVQVGSGQSLETAVLREISISGALIDTPVPPPVGSQVQVSLAVCRPPHVWAQSLTARVVRKIGDAYALEWVGVSPATIITLMSMFEFVPLTADFFSAPRFKGPTAPLLSHSPN